MVAGDDAISRLQPNLTNATGNRTAETPVCGPCLGLTIREAHGLFTPLAVEASCVQIHDDLLPQQIAPGKAGKLPLFSTLLTSPTDTFLCPEHPGGQAPLITINCKSAPPALKVLTKSQKAAFQKIEPR